jgi:hypothetical protein
MHGGRDIQQRSWAEATAQPVENTKPFYEAYQKKHYIERTTSRHLRLTGTGYYLCAARDGADHLHGLAHPRLGLLLWRR